MMEQRYRALFFDLDGTLIDSLPDVHRCINLVLERMELPTLAPEQARRAIGPGADNFSRVVLPTDERHRIDEFMTLFKPIYRDGCRVETRPYHGIVELLETVRDRDLAVITNKGRMTTESILQGLGLRDYFKLVITPESVARIKPAPDMVQLALQQLALPASAALMVGDTDNDVLAARAAGVAVCAAGWGYALPGYLETLQPEYYAETPAQLQRMLPAMGVIKAVG